VPDAALPSAGLDEALESLLVLPSYVRCHLKTRALSYYGSVEAGYFTVTLMDAYTDADWDSSERLNQ